SPRTARARSTTRSSAAASITGSAIRMPSASLRSCAPRCRASARYCPSRSCISCRRCARRICSSRPASRRRSTGRRRSPSSTWRRSIRRPSPTRSACCSSIKTTSRASKAARRRSCSTRCARSCAPRSENASTAQASRLRPLPLRERAAPAPPGIRMGEGSRPEPLTHSSLREHRAALSRKGRGPSPRHRMCREIVQAHACSPPHLRGDERMGLDMTRDEGRLAENILYFARALRAAGIPVGPGAVLDALAAVEAAGVGTREDFYWTLHAVFVKRHEHSILFEQAFRVFFRRRGFLDQLLASLLPQAPPSAPPAPRPGAQRIDEALFSGLRESEPQTAEREVDARLTVSDRELLQRKDFAQMTAAEVVAAKDAIKQLVLTLDEVKTRRLAPHRHGHVVDIRRTLRGSLKAGGAVIDLKYLGPATKSPPIVALLDISGSMSQYTRLFLHFLHAVTDARKRVHTFLFGTRLTNVTRALRHKDPDEALAAVSASVPDWSGGTRIASSLKAFTKLWARRVLRQGAIVLLITDGLEREGGESLAFEIDRLHRSSRRLIWLNPLLRFSGFEAKAKGIRSMLPHVDELRPIHNLDSMAA